MLGVQTVLNGGWAHREIFIPPKFLHNAWNLFLPKGSSSVLLSVMCYVIRGYSKDELIKLMFVEERELYLTPFQFEQPTNDLEEDNDLYLQTLERETGIKKILERSGFSYPKNIEEFIYLFIHTGIILEVNYRGAVFLDILIEPFPYPEESLTLTKNELKVMLEHRQAMKESS